MQEPSLKHVLQHSLLFSPSYLKPGDTKQRLKMGSVMGNNVMLVA